MVARIGVLLSLVLAVPGCYRAIEPASDASPDAGAGPDSGEIEMGTDAAASPDTAADSGVLCVPSPEICNAIDDDCDGRVDEEPEASTWCGARCGVDECPRARPMSPLANTLLSGQLPTFRWALVGGADAARVEVCRDRDCAIVIATATGTTSATPSAPLSRGPVFWRLVPQRSGRDLPAVSPPWITRIPSVAAGTVSGGATGIVTDVDADGWSDLVVPTWRSALMTQTAYTLYTGSSTGLVRQLELPMTIDGVVCMEDFDGDGHTDAYVGERPLATDGAAGLRRGAPYDLLGPAAGPLAAELQAPAHSWFDAFGDVDSDGFPDLYDGQASRVPMGPPAPVAVADGSADGLRATSNVIPAPPYAQPDLAAGVFPVGDLDADGTADFVAAQSCLVGSVPVECPMDHTMWCILGGATGIQPPRPCAQAPRLLPPYSEWEGVLDAIRPTGDLDGDGLVDLVATISRGADGENTFLLLQHDFSPDHNAWSSLDPAIWLGPACDLDGDGAGDLVLRNGSDLSVTADTFLQRGGPGGLRPEHIHLSDLRAVATRCLGDGDGDGFSEIAVLLLDPSVVSPSDPRDTYVLHVYRGMPGGVNPTPVQVIPIGRGQPRLF